MLIYAGTFVEGRYSHKRLPKVREVPRYRHSCTRVDRGGMLNQTDDARPAPTLQRKAVSNAVGRDARTNLDALAPVLDGDSFRRWLDSFVTEKQQTFWELRGILKRRQEGTNRRSARHNAAIERSSSGEQTRVGDKVLIKEAPRKLGRENVDAKLAHEHWTGPWRTISVEQPGLSYQTTTRGRRIRGRDDLCLPRYISGNVYCSILLQCYWLQESNRLVCV